MAASTAGSMQREIDALKRALQERDGEVGQCHKRIRALTSPAAPLRTVTTGSEVLDLLLTHAVVPYAKDPRPAYLGLRSVVSLTLQNEYSRQIYDRRVKNVQTLVPRDLEKIPRECVWHFLSDERRSCLTLCRVRATCTSAMKVNNDNSHVDLYLKDAKFRFMAAELHLLACKGRRYIVQHRRLGPFGLPETNPIKVIGESEETVSKAFPDYNRAVQAVGRAHARAMNQDSPESESDSESE